MKPSLASPLLIAFAAIAACSPAATENRSAPANAVAPVAPPENSAGADAGSAPVDRAFLIGRWGRDGDCSNVLDFRGDGSVAPPEGSRWTMAGNIVTITGPSGRAQPRAVARNGPDGMTVSGGGTTMNLTRCLDE